ncbi:alpha-amylase family glycosyl hydrolase [Bacillus carboniphilus]|uniref:Alpha-amylase family glycosyl hydrolase n=1 Tax=Bacillus carboniphilus TaxID=86663 RepID=A0ABY9JVE8_9BACI|nr:alpha-amylase family glycosyl hydrolase [Bacillus carboniphilus]WLR42713.1 alpha-amylase family glycosyl hydrolase [Bacillus carboniphilus]
MKRGRKLFIVSMIFALIFSFLPQKVAEPIVVEAASTQAEEGTFSWDNATVYFVLTDRFLDGDESNNNSYGREQDANGNTYSDYKDKEGTFHGGDLKGLTKKINEGYFTDLGVNALWITAPYEQIHGWIGGENFRHYSYHGYYPLDYTEVDANMGTAEDLRSFMDTAHEKGIRVVFDIVMNHAGYYSMKDMNEFGFGTLQGDWYNYYYNSSDYEAHYDTYGNYINTTDRNSWSKWWGSDWVRAGVAGYQNGGSDDYTMTLAGLPDFKTEATSSVDLPKILQTKWDDEKEIKERAELDAFFDRTGYERTPDNYIIKWLTDWVREYGVDGFRADTAKHVNIEDWGRLKAEATLALQEWKTNNPDKALDEEDFWMTGEVWGHGVGKSDYFNNGFDSVINFDYQGSAGNLSNIENIYSSYASSINSDSSFNVLSYISSHDTSLYRGDMIDAGTAFFMLPGGVQIFYGDETARPIDYSATWSDFQTRSDMNWDSINTNVLEHWQKLGQFRNKHIAVGAGNHNQMSNSPYTFSRTYDHNGVTDKVVAVFEAAGSTTVDVSSVFVDGTNVVDFYTGNMATVENGKVTFTAHSNGVILIEEEETPYPAVSSSQQGGKFHEEKIEVTLSVSNTDQGYYTLDGSDPAENGKRYSNGKSISIGEGMDIGDQVTLRLYATNEYGNISQSYTFEKVEQEQLIVHFKLPSGWGSPQLFYYGTDPKISEPSWATAPTMTDEGDGWYTYTIVDDNTEYVESAYVIFKDDLGNQTPAQNESGMLVQGEKWFDGTTWYDNNPDNDTEIPTTPSNITASSVGSSSVTLSWSDSSDNNRVTGYNVYRDGKLIGTTTGTSFTDSGLKAKTTYQYKVSAKDNAGNESSLSEEVKVTTTNGKEVTIYYKSDNQTNIHYRQSDHTWTTVPGVAMADSSYDGFKKITINMDDLDEFEAVFNDGHGNWDNNNGSNYLFSQGTWTLIDGVMIEGEPTTGNSLTMKVHAPNSTEAIYLASSLNHWNPADQDYELQETSDGAYQMKLQLSQGTTIQFKFTQGSWSAVEVSSSGSDISNRTFTKGTGEEAIELTVESWK